MSRRTTDAVSIAATLSMRRAEEASLGGDRIEPGAVNTEVMVALPGGSVVTAVVTKESAKRISLAKGEHVCALVKASSVILGVDA